VTKCFPVLPATDIQQRGCHFGSGPKGDTPGAKLHLFDHCSITLSAVDSSFGGTVMPSIFAVRAFAASGMGLGDQFARQDVR
jgi:hypothetical protein